MMDVAILGGTGNLGFGLALRLARAGLRVVIGSRDAQKAGAAAAQATAAAGCQVFGLANPEAAAAAPVVVLAVPAEVLPRTLETVRTALAGKVVVDTCVSLAPGDPTRVELPPAGSSAQTVAELLGPSVRVATAFHTVSGKLLANLDKPIEGDILIAGDDPEAKAAVGRLVEAIGARPLDAGPLSNAGMLERLTALIIGMNKRYKRRHIGLHFTGV